VSVDIDGNPIYKTPPSAEMISERVEKYHDAFHFQIEELKPQARFLIDGHSMRGLTPSTKPDAGSKRADIVLGNRHYISCSRQMTRKIMEFFESRGLKVKVNDPFTGRYIIGYHCSRTGFPGIQVEVNEHLFMNPKTYRPYQKNIQALQIIMTELVEMINDEIMKSEGSSKASGSPQSKLF